eukprot:TRINITY_DN97246_c0_g1_i1.p1 TRINITY_DN97246_c0_g1~~TRINITY_DN97246_c0_g1_i1.p1  ORF type:complete len:393 (+),score=51.38 TRINITY_DN97246_c0_g1_i1:50-1180(+)
MGCGFSNRVDCFDPQTSQPQVVDADIPWVDHSDDKLSSRPNSARTSANCVVEYQTDSFCCDSTDQRTWNTWKEVACYGEEGQVPSLRTHPFHASSDEQGKFSIVVLTLPVTLEIVSFLGEASDFVNLAYKSSKEINDNCAQFDKLQWEQLYQYKWPVFHTALAHTYSVRERAAPWKKAYQRTLDGKHEQLLEIFDREKKQGFTMSCMLARVSWNQAADSYTASYLSASRVPPESISVKEVHRLRYCPASVRAELKPEFAPPDASDVYGYRVLTGGFQDLEVGQGVELQWKMQLGSPFGWWYGEVESVHPIDQRTADVNMLFKHFPESSRWYRLRVTVGDGTMRRCAIGGHHGGIRGVSGHETKQWMQFFPKRPIVL